jgi:hypothetical protein
MSSTQQQQHPAAAAAGGSSRRAMAAASTLYIPLLEALLRTPDCCCNIALPPAANAWGLAAGAAAEPPGAARHVAPAPPRRPAPSPPSPSQPPPIPPPPALLQSPGSGQTAYGMCSLLRPPAVWPAGGCAPARRRWALQVPMPGAWVGGRRSWGDRGRAGRAAQCGSSSRRAAALAACCLPAVWGRPGGGKGPTECSSHWEMPLQQTAADGSAWGAPGRSPGRRRLPWLPAVLGRLE